MDEDSELVHGWQIRGMATSAADLTVTPPLEKATPSWP